MWLVDLNINNNVIGCQNMRSEVEEKLTVAMAAMDMEMRKVYEIGGLPHFQAIQQEVGKSFRLPHFQAIQQEVGKSLDCLTFRLSNRR